jgi:micrococcal nuclease
MHRRILLLTALIMLPPIAQSDESSRYPLVAVEEGDTVTIQVDGEIKRLQLDGIDAPEDAANPKLAKDIERTGLSSTSLLALGQAATTHLKRLVAPGDALEVAGDLAGSDRYGRIPVFISKEKLDLNAAMVADGYAVVLKRASIAPEIMAELSALQRQAQQDKRGLWGSHPEETLRWSGL